MNVYVIGCGGVGSWLIPSLTLLIGKKNLFLIDGDMLEQKNLNRQLFTPNDLGKNKAEALAFRYGIPSYLGEWYSVGKLDHDPNDILMVCVDNDAARISALLECDRCNCSCIISANETFSAEAYYYRPEWKDTPVDPRVFYPDMKLERGPDPARRSAGCTGQAQEETPQLVSANFMAASLAQHLFVLWAMEFPKMGLDSLLGMPFHYRANMTRLETVRVRERMEKQST